MDIYQTELNNFALNTISSAQTSVTTDNLLNDSENSIDNQNEINRFSRPLLTFAATMTILIMITGIFGNLLTVIALLKCPKVRNVAAAFIISLCIADCIFCSIVLPFNAFRFIQGTWTHGETLCRIIPFIQYGNIGVSLLCIAMITINRYIMITHHSSYSRIYKQHWIGLMIAFCWIFSYGMQLPTFFQVWGTFGYDKNLGTCSILNDANGRSSKTVLFIIAFLIPCLIIIGCYARIFWVVHKSELRLRQHASKQNSIPNNMRPSVSAGDSRISSTSYDENSVTDKRSGGLARQKSIGSNINNIKGRRNEWRITKMVLAIFLSFVACYLPITVIKIADKDVRYPGFHIFGYIMLYLSSCINPIIYVIMNKQYRQAYKTVLTCSPARLLAYTNGSSHGEKLKDIGYSYNHSRTMVSQISIAEYNQHQRSHPEVTSPRLSSMGAIHTNMPTNIITSSSNNTNSINNNTPRNSNPINIKSTTMASDNSNNINIHPGPLPTANLTISAIAEEEVPEDTNPTTATTMNDQSQTKDIPDNINKNILIHAKAKDINK